MTDEKSRDELKLTEATLAIISEQKRAEERLAKLNNCFLDFGPDPDKNIQKLTALCGELMGATSALYNRMDDDMLCSVGMWNTPGDYKAFSPAKGHICFDVIAEASDEIRVIRNLPHTPFARTDPAVESYKLLTYVGKAVKCEGRAVGSICAVYQRDVLPSEAERKYLEIIASVIGVEEERRNEDNRVKLFFRAVEQSPSIVIITDTEGNIEYTNPKFSQVTGFSKDEVLGKNPRLLKSGETTSDEYQRLWKTITSGAEWNGEFHNRKKNGELYWEHALISPVKNSQGKIIRFLAIKEDITEHKKWESELATLASYPLLNPNPIVEIDEAGVVTYLNPAARMRFQDFLPMGQRYPFLNDLELVIDAAFKLRDSNIVRQAEFSNSVFEQHIYSVPEIGRLRIYMSDITERAKMEQMKDDFVGTVSHELRTPLSITKEGISLLLEGAAGRLGASQKRILSTSRENIDRLGRIIEGLLDVSKIESGALLLKRKLVDVAKLTRDAVGLFRQKAADKKIRLGVRIPSHEVLAFADSDKIVQVIVNLTGNAVKFTSKGKVAVSLKEESDYIVCSIADTGPGIPRSELRKIFNKFHQFGRAAERKEKGAGLGLSIAKGLIEMHEGRIWVESSIGKGTTFSFSLPRKSPEELLSEHIIGGIKNAIDKQGKISIIVLEFVGISTTHLRMNADALKKLKLGVKGSVRTRLRNTEDVVLEVGDELVVLLMDCDALLAEKIGARIRESIDDFMQHEGVADKIIPMMGKATYPCDAKSDEELLKVARSEASPWCETKPQPERRPAAKKRPLGKRGARKRK